MGPEEEAELVGGGGGRWVVGESAESEEADDEGEEHDEVEDGETDLRRLELHRLVADLERNSLHLHRR